jgi:hypothetical protein
MMIELAQTIAARVLAHTGNTEAADEYRSGIMDDSPMMQDLRAMLAEFDKSE